MAWSDQIDGYCEWTDLRHWPEPLNAVTNGPLLWNVAQLYRDAAIFLIPVKVSRHAILTHTRPSKRGAWWFGMQDGAAVAPSGVCWRSIPSRVRHTHRCNAAKVTDLVVQTCQSWQITNRHFAAVSSNVPDGDKPVVTYLHLNIHFRTLVVILISVNGGTKHLPEGET